MDNTSEPVHDVNDDVGGKTGSCREHTLLCDHQDSQPTGWIRGHTRIGSVRQVKVICCRDQCGIKIQVPSTSRNGSYSWIVTHTATWMNRGMAKMTLLEALRW